MDGTLTQCDNCGKVAGEFEIVPVEEVRNLLDRTEVGFNLPAGECRECGALVWAVEVDNLDSDTLTEQGRCPTCASKLTSEDICPECQAEQCRIVAAADAR